MEKQSKIKNKFVPIFCLHFFPEKRRASNELVEVLYEPEKYEDRESNSNIYGEISHESESQHANSAAFTRKTQDPNDTTNKTYEVSPKRRFQDVNKNMKPRKKVVPFRNDYIRDSEVQSNQVIIETTTLPVLSCIEARHPSQTLDGTRRTVPYSDYIALERKNKKLKELLATFTKDAEDIQVKMRQWTDLFKTFSKSEHNDATSIESTAKSYVNTSLLESEPEADDDSYSKECSEIISRTSVPVSIAKGQRNPDSSLNITPNQVGSSKENNSSKKPEADKPVQQNTTQINLRPERKFLLPTFPINCIRAFINFEKNLREREYHDFAQYVLFQLHRKTFKVGTINRLTFSALLSEIVTNDLFKIFIWENDSKGKLPKSNRLRLVDFSNFIYLFLTLSVKLFAPDKDPELLKPIIYQILRSHIIKANAKRQFPSRKRQVVYPAKKTANAAAKVVVLNYDLNRDRESSESPIHSEITTSAQINEDPAKLIINPIANIQLPWDDPTTAYEQDEESSKSDDDVQDVTPAPVSIEIADDSD